MSWRRIGQEDFGFVIGKAQRHTALDDLAGLIDCVPMERQLAEISSAAKGEPAWPPLALFKATVLAVWYDLSDIKLAEALDDQASFCRFCGSSVREATPERTAFVHFRKALVGRGLDKALFDTMTARLEANASSANDGKRLKHKSPDSPRRSESRRARWSTSPSSPRPARVMARPIGSSTRASPPCMASRRTSELTPTPSWSRTSRSHWPMSMTARLGPMLCTTIPARSLPPRDCFEGSIGKTPEIVASDIASRHSPIFRFPRESPKFSPFQLFQGGLFNNLGYPQSPAPRKELDFAGKASMHGWKPGESHLEIC